MNSASSSLSVPSPSFTTSSSQNLADTAARVLHELHLSPNHVEYDDVEPEPEFEFAILSDNNTSSPISADDIFQNGLIKPIGIYYPLFNLPQPDTVSSSSSSLSDDGEHEPDNADLEGVPQETYCVWSPKNKQILEKKSNSTGTKAGEELSKRWRLTDVLLNRSHSDGKDNFVFLQPGNNNNVGEKKSEGKVTAVKVYGKKNGEGKKKTYLTYRPELVGFFW